MLIAGYGACPSLSWACRTPDHTQHVHASTDMGIAKRLAGKFDFFIFHGFSQFAQCAGFDLADPFLGDAQFHAHFFERQRFLAAIRPKRLNDDLLLALVQPLEDLADLRFALRLRRLSCSTWSVRSSSVAANISDWLVRKRSRWRCSSGIVRAKFFMIAQLAYVLNLFPRA